MIYRMTFDGEHIPGIYTGEKYRTARPKSEWGHLKPGDLLLIQTPDGESLGFGRITEVARMSAAAFVAWDPDGHRSYPSLGYFKETFRDYYPNRYINGNTPLVVVKFDATIPRESYAQWLSETDVDAETATAE